MWCFQLSPSSCLLSDLIMHQGHAGDMEACEEDDDEDERCWEASLQKALRGVVADLISELEEEHEHAHVPFCGDPEGRAGQDKTAVQGSSAQGGFAYPDMQTVRAWLPAVGDASAGDLAEVLSRGMRDEPEAMQCIWLQLGALRAADSVHRPCAGNACASAGASDAGASLHAGSCKRQSVERWFSPLPPLPPPSGSLNAGREQPSNQLLPSHLMRLDWLCDASGEEEAGNANPRLAARANLSQARGTSRGGGEAHSRRLSTPARRTTHVTSPSPRCSLGSFVHAHSWRPGNKNAFVFCPLWAYSSFWHTHAPESSKI